MAIAVESSLGVFATRRGNRLGGCLEVAGALNADAFGLAIDARDEATQHLARADFDEQADAILQHLLDGLLPAHRSANLLDQGVAQMAAAILRLSIQIGVDSGGDVDEGSRFKERLSAAPANRPRPLPQKSKDRIISQLDVKLFFQTSSPTEVDMGKALMVQDEDDRAIECLKDRLGKSTKVEVIRAGLRLLEAQVAHEERLNR